MELTRHFPPEALAGALRDWAWLPDLAGKVPLVLSAFGDVFLTSDDGIWFLDTIEGTVTREWDHAADLQDALNSLQGQDRYLLLGLVEAAADAGIEPGPSEVLWFKRAPILGGEFAVENLQVGDLQVVLSLGAQLHRQLTQLPPGTPISEFTFDQD